MKPTIQELILSHRDKIYRLCHSFFYRVEDVNDLFQEVLINIWKSYPSFRGESAVGTWIYRITVNTALMHVRSEQNRRDRFVPLEIDVHEHELTDGEKNEEISRLRLEISRLPMPDRVIISMMLEGFSYQEIADVTGITPTHVGVKINRIKEKLSKVLSNE